MAHRLENLQQDLLLGGSGNEVKMQLVNWKTVCQPLQLGGLGIRSLTLKLPYWVSGYATLL